MSYSADLSPTQVWAMMEEYPDNVVVVDVRTQAEWSFVGLPETTPVMKPVVAQEWQMFPSMSVDPEFTAALANKLSRLSLDKDAKLCFLCLLAYNFLLSRIPSIFLARRALLPTSQRASETRSTSLMNLC